MDCERRVPVDVVKAGDDDIKDSAAPDMSLDIVSSASMARQFGWELRVNLDEKQQLGGMMIDACGAFGKG